VAAAAAAVNPPTHLFIHLGHCGDFIITSNGVWNRQQQSHTAFNKRVAAWSDGLQVVGLVAVAIVCLVQSVQVALSAMPWEGL